MTDPAQPLPAAAIVVTHPVADFDAWKASFDAHQPARRDAGALGHHLNRAEDDPNVVTVYMAVADLDRAKAFAESDDLQAEMRNAGVTAAPEVMWLTPVRDAIVRDRQLPAMVVRHGVADFDRWLEGYDGADDMRASKGIVGHAANRSLDDPSVAVVYHQAESFDTLRAFLQDPVLLAAMQEAGVSSEPEVTFYTGGWAQQYG